MWIGYIDQMTKYLLLEWFVSITKMICTVWVKDSVMRIYEILPKYNPDMKSDNCRRHLFSPVM